MRVALLEPGRGDPDQLAPLLQLGDGRRAGVAHARPQAADELVGDARQRAAVGHLALDALGYELVVGADVVLEVPVLGVRPGLPAGLHRAQRAHAPVGLELLAVDEDQLAGALLAAGQQRAEHHRVGAGDDRLGDVAGVLHAAVADHRHAGRPAGPGRLHDRGDLRHADPGDHPGGADRAGPDADLDRVGARLDQRLRAGVGGDVAADDVDRRRPA